MRISDWSSDVCSSDLAPVFAGGAGIGLDEIAHRAALQHRPSLVDQQQLAGRSRGPRHGLARHEHDRRKNDASKLLAAREVTHLEHREIVIEREAGLKWEERRVGKECDSTG